MRPTGLRQRVEDEGPIPTHRQTEFSKSLVGCSSEEVEIYRQIIMDKLLQSIKPSTTAQFQHFLGHHYSTNKQKSPVFLAAPLDSEEQVSRLIKCLQADDESHMQMLGNICTLYNVLRLSDVREQLCPRKFFENIDAEQAEAIVNMLDSSFQKSHLKAAWLAMKSDHADRIEHLMKVASDAAQKRSASVGAESMVRHSFDSGKASISVDASDPFNYGFFPGMISLPAPQDVYGASLEVLKRYGSNYLESTFGAELETRKGLFGDWWTAPERKIQFEILKKYVDEAQSLPELISACGHTVREVVSNQTYGKTAKRSSLAKCALELEKFYKEIEAHREPVLAAAVKPSFARGRMM